MCFQMDALSEDTSRTETLNIDGLNKTGLDGQLLNSAALFTDETENFRFPMEPDEGEQVHFRFRTAKDDVDDVFFLLSGGTLEVPMKKFDTDGVFDYYVYRIRAVRERLSYGFKVVRGDQTYYYNRLGLAAQNQEALYFKLVPGFHTPDWAKGAVMYQIFVDRFRNGDPSNDVVDREYLYVDQPVSRVLDWNQYPLQMDVGRFYGGDLKGVWDKLDYLQSLGVDAIYFNPIFVSPSNHKYDCQDYDHVDPHYGVIAVDAGEPLSPSSKDNGQASKYRIRTTSKVNLEASDAFFARFVEEVHRRGMRVILDGVFNHCGSFNKWFDGELIYQMAGDYETGAFVSEDSPYHTFFKFYQDGKWPCNASYDGWWGHSTLPKLNYEDSPKLYEYILRIARKWVSPPYNADGWRLDVAADLGHSGQFNHGFWRDFRRAVKEANPDALVLAEHYGDPSSWLTGDQWDTVMNYDAFMEPVTWFLTGMEKHSDEYNQSLRGDGERFFRSMNYHMSHMATGSILTAMNELSNHDHSRFLTRTNRKEGRIGTNGPGAASEGIDYGVFRQAVVIQMTWPGAPTIYYGDEAGVCGWTDPDNRRTYPWGGENLEMIEFHRYMTKLHHGSPALMRGSLKPLVAEKGLIAYGRFFGDSVCAVAVNEKEEERTVRLPVWQLGAVDGERLARLMLTTKSGYNVGRTEYLVENGEIILLMAGGSAVLLAADRA